HEQGVSRGEQVIEHDAEAAVEAALEPVDGRGLDDVEGTEKNKGGGLPRKIARQDGKHQEEGDHLVDHHGRVILYAEMAARYGARPPTDGEEEDDQRGEERGWHHTGGNPADRPCRQRSRGARRPRRKSRPEPEG